MDCEDLELQVNADEMCRACLCHLPPEQLKPIFCNEILEGKIVPFPKILEVSTGIKPAKDEVFPKNVCINCKIKLKEFYAFKDKVLQSRDLLYEIFGVKMPESEPVPKQSTAQLPPKTQTATIETQTDQIRLREVDENIYRRFLILEKVPKPVMTNVGTQITATTRDASMQINILNNKITKCVSTQATSPLPKTQHCSTQVDCDELNKMIEPIVLEYQEKSYHNLNIIDQLEKFESTDDKSDLAEEPVEVMVEIEHDGFKSVGLERGKSRSVKLEIINALSEQDYEQESIEYLTYEDVENVATSESESILPASKKIAGRKATYECNYCQFTTPSKQTFTEHNTIHQQSIEDTFDRAEYYRCMSCKRVYASTADLATHFIEDSCSAVHPVDFVESNEVTSHEQFYSHFQDMCIPSLKSFSKNHQSQIICSKCSLGHCSLTDALEHYNSEHDNEDVSHQELTQIWRDNEYNQIHICGLCNEQFVDASFIRQHVYFHRATFDCPYCPEAFVDFYKLTVHIDRKHLKAANLPTTASGEDTNATTDVDMVCEICCKRFNSKASFKVHTRNHFADRRHTCPMCPKAFIQKSDLTIHIRSHTDERPFSCTVAGCDKKFRTSSHRRDHMSTHALEKKYQCHVCHKHFKAERILQGHLRLHSGLKPYECDQCGKSFSRKHHVKLHMKTHTNK